MILVCVPMVNLSSHIFFIILFFQVLRMAVLKQHAKLASVVNV
jgi:hypothetical protein